VPELPPEVRELLEGPNYVHLATLMPDGSPHSVPVWAGLEDGKVGFFTQTSSRKAKNVERDPRVALSIVDGENPYRMAQIRGRVVEKREGEAALTVMDRFAHAYTGDDFPMRQGVLYLIEIEKVQNMTLPFEHKPG
jgi:PPOX class probable F420-dependent enzyme